MIGAPEVLQIGGGDELEAGGDDGGVAEDVEVIFRDVAADAERVTGETSGVLRADVFEIDHHRPTGVEFALQHGSGFFEAIVIGRVGDEFPLLADLRGGIEQVPPVGAGAERRWAEFFEVPAADVAALEACKRRASGAAAVVVALEDVRHLHEGELARLALALAILDELQEVRALLRGGIVGRLRGMTRGGGGLDDFDKDGDVV